MEGKRELNDINSGGKLQVSRAKECTSKKRKVENVLGHLLDVGVERGLIPSLFIAKMHKKIIHKCIS